MDVQMPELDGLDATSAIRAWEKSAGTHIPIIAMTAHAMKGDRERCLAAGMDGYTSKPIRIRELEQAIARLVSPSKPAEGPCKKRLKKTASSMVRHCWRVSMEFAACFANSSSFFSPIVLDAWQE